MKKILFISFLFLSVNSFAQITGKIFYDNFEKSKALSEQFKKNGIEIAFAPIKIDLQKSPEIQKVISDYKLFV